MLSKIIITGSYDVQISHYFLMLSVTIIWILTSNSTNLYDDYRSRNFSYEFITLLKNAFIQLIIIIVLLFVIGDLSLGRTFVLLYISFVISITGWQKYLFRKFLFLLIQHKRSLRTLLIIGAGEVGLKFYNSIRNNPHYGYKLIGFLDDNKCPSLNGEYLGKVDCLEKILDTSIVDNVIIALPNYAMEKIDFIVNTCERYTTRVRIIPDYFRFMSSKYSLSMFGNLPIISVREDKINELHWRLSKRLFDFVFSLCVIVFVFPWLYPIIYICIKSSSKGDIIFRQERWGRNNKKFWLYKFRSMKMGNNDVDCNGKYIQAVKDDPRVTKIGKFLRRTNFDELPQFFNVLLGNMSVVGPRPHPIPLNQESRNNIKQYMLRHLVKPGITGWAQVHGFRGATKGTCLMQKRIEFDLWYIENWSFWLDIQIIILTVWNMVRGDPKAY